MPSLLAMKRNNEVDCRQVPGGRDELTVILMEWQEKLLKRCKTVANIAC